MLNRLRRRVGDAIRNTPTLTDGSGGITHGLYVHALA